MDPMLPLEGELRVLPEEGFDGSLQYLSESLSVASPLHARVLPLRPARKELDLSDSLPSLVFRQRSIGSFDFSRGGDRTDSDREG